MLTNELRHEARQLLADLRIAALVVVKQLDEVGSVALGDIDALRTEAMK